jgi:Na+/proline symporter
VGIGISFLVGFATLFLVHGEAENFFVAGRSLPLWIVAMTLGAQSIDSNAILGNADLSYKFQFYDGAVLPIGLGLSLILNGLFLARHINAERNVLTLPDGTFAIPILFLKNVSCRRFVSFFTQNSLMITLLSMLP